MRRPEGPILVTGGGGAQGVECAGYLRGAEPAAQIVAIDRHFSTQARSRLEELSVELRELDLLGDPEKLRGEMAGASVLINLAGPFYSIGPAVLDAAIATGTAYVDICDDVDATALLLDRHEAAERAGVVAIVGMGSAPGTTNLLVKLGLQHLGAGFGEGTADIAWCAPGGTLTFGIFQHLVHCFRTALPGQHAKVPDWDALEPRTVEFPEPIGGLEVVRLGHPEPLTLARQLGCAAMLRGGMTGDGILRRSWELARACDEGLGIDQAWAEMQAALPRLEPGEPEWSGMVIDVCHGATGLRFDSATTISMEQSTAVPAVAVALMLRGGADVPPGVWPPEVLEPAAFFEAGARISPGGGGLGCHTLRDGERAERISLRTLFAKPEAN